MRRVFLQQTLSRSYIDDRDERYSFGEDWMEERSEARMPFKSFIIQFVFGATNTSSQKTMWGMWSICWMRRRPSQFYYPSVCRRHYIHFEGTERD
jgi:hypothetical protein